MLISISPFRSVLLCITAAAAAARGDLALFIRHPMTSFRIPLYTAIIARCYCTSVKCGGAEQRAARMMTYMVSTVQSRNLALIKSVWVVK